LCFVLCEQAVEKNENALKASLSLAFNFMVSAFLNFYKRNTASFDEFSTLEPYSRELNIFIEVCIFSSF
jgi:hypothetical protein